MRKIIFIILSLFIGLGALADFNSPSEAIKIHREWMKQNCLKPESLNDEQLMIEASKIIDLRLQEDEAFHILSAAAKKVPEVMDYINWAVAFKCDTLCLRKRNALSGMADYLDIASPNCYAARRIRCDFYYLESMFRDVIPEYNSAIKKQEVICSKTKDKKEKALLLLLKMYRFEARGSQEQVDNPLHYPELWQLEKEVLDLYPADSDEICEERMQLYLTLGNLKSQPSERIYVDLMIDHPNIFNNGTLYIYTGKYMDYPCNTPFYFEKAIEISESIFGEAHPTTFSISYLMAQFSIQDTTLDKEFEYIANLILDWYSLYYPTSAIENTTVSLLKGVLNFQLQGSFNISWDRRRVLEAISKLYYGENNTYHLSTLHQLAWMALYEDEDYTSTLDAFEKSCRKAFPNDNLRPLAWLFSVYNQVKFRNPEEGVKRINSLKVQYFAFHNGSPQSYYIGKQLKEYYCDAAFDFDTAVEVLNILENDAAKLFGNPSAIYYKTRIDNFISKVTGMDESEINIINDIINDINRNEFTSKKRIYNDALKSKALYCWNQANYKDAHEAYSLILNSTAKKDIMTEDRARDVICRLLGNIDTKNLDKEVLAIEADIEKLDSLNRPIYALIDLGNYYWHKNQLDKAIKWYESALDLHNMQTNNTLNDDYLQISESLASLYDRTDNSTAAARIVTNDRECLRDAKHIFPSTALCYYLLNSYFRSISKSDMASAFFYFTGFSNLYNQLIISSGNPDYMKYTLGIKMVQACVQLYVFFEDFLKNNDELINSGQLEQFNVDVDQFKAQFTQWIPSMKTMMEELYEGFPTYDPNYKSNPDFVTLLSSIGAYYQSCERNFGKAEKYILMALDLNQDENTSKGMYLFLSGLMDKAGNSEKRDMYLEKAYSIVDNSSVINSQDVINSLAFKFHKAIKNREIPEATSLAREIYAQNRRILDSNFKLMSSSEQEQFFNTYGDPAWALVNLLEHSPKNLATETYNAVVYRTGMQLRSQQEIRNLIASSNRPEIRAIADSIAMLKDRQKMINTTPDQWMTAQANENYLKSRDMAFSIEHLEMQLLDMLAEERKDDAKETTWMDILRSLKQNEVAIEFLQSDSKLMALVLKPGISSPIPVCLGNHKDLTEGLSSLNAKNSASLAAKLYSENSPVNLYSIIWEPLERELSDCKTVYFSAPGLLHTISFNAIRTPDGSYLMDKYDLRQLTSTAQLTIATDNSAPKSAGLLGDVLFDPSQAEFADIQPESSGVRAVDDDYSLNDFKTRGAERHYFRYLPYTGKELAEISQTFADCKVESIVKENATEEALRNLCSISHDVLHLATHGFFISSEKEALDVPFMKRYLNFIGSAMQRSGVALANAEISWKSPDMIPEENDGILTANEVSKLNLKGTRLVTLSACETALGDYNFEGIHGLTRGFKQAGAQSMLVSLWSVNDASTAQFMTTFYREWIRTGNRHAAYRSAMAAVRDSNPSPFYWAPFILLD